MGAFFSSARGARKKKTGLSAASPRLAYGGPVGFPLQSLVPHGLFAASKPKEKSTAKSKKLKKKAKKLKFLRPLVF
jgi:hypothetical protein